LLVVIAIISLVYVFTLPAVNTMLTSYRIGAGGDMVAGTLGAARHSRHLAESNGRDPLYQYASMASAASRQPALPPASSRRPDVYYNSSGLPIAITKVQQMPDGIIIDSGTLSPSSPHRTAEDIHCHRPAGARPEVSGTNYICAAYQINPGGTSVPFRPAISHHPQIPGWRQTQCLAEEFRHDPGRPVSATIRTYKP